HTFWNGHSGRCLHLHCSTTRSIAPSTEFFGDTRRLKSGIPECQRFQWNDWKHELGGRFRFSVAHGDAWKRDQHRDCRGECFDWIIGGRYLYWTSDIHRDKRGNEYTASCYCHVRHFNASSTNPDSRSNSAESLFFGDRRRLESGSGEYQHHERRWRNLELDGRYALGMARDSSGKRDR